MITSLFVALFSLLFPDLRDTSSTVAVYYEFYQKVDRIVSKKEGVDADRIKADFKHLKKETFRYGKVVMKQSNEFWDIDSDYSATIEDYYAVLEKQELVIDSLTQITFDARDLLAKELTEDEWNEAFDDLDRFISKTIKKREKQLNK